MALRSAPILRRLEPNLEPRSGMPLLAPLDCLVKACLDRVSLDLQFLIRRSRAPDEMAILGTRAQAARYEPLFHGRFFNVA